MTWFDVTERFGRPSAAPRGRWGRLLALLTWKPRTTRTFLYVDPGALTFTAGLKGITFPPDGSYDPDLALALKYRHSAVIRQQAHAITLIGDSPHA